MYIFIITFSSFCLFLRCNGEIRGLAAKIIKWQSHIFQLKMFEPTHLRFLQQIPVITNLPESRVRATRLRRGTRARRVCACERFAIIIFPANTINCIIQYYYAAAAAAAHPSTVAVWSGREERRVNRLVSLGKCTSVYARAPIFSRKFLFFF